MQCSGCWRSSAVAAIAEKLASFYASTKLPLSANAVIAEMLASFCASTIAENRRLAAEAAETGLDAWETVAFLRAELLDREAEVARLGAALAQARGYRGNACHGPAHRCTPSGCSPGRAVDGAHDTCMWTVCCAQKATALQKRCLSLRRRSLLVWQGSPRRATQASAGCASSRQMRPPLPRQQRRSWRRRVRPRQPPSLHTGWVHAARPCQVQPTQDVTFAWQQKQCYVTL